jgi:hypothetical protein
VAFSTISHIQLFRDYLHYHSEQHDWFRARRHAERSPPLLTVKCSKAYMHSRMRHRVAEFLKILNRAKPEQAEKERKTARCVMRAVTRCGVHANAVLHVLQRPLVPPGIAAGLLRDVMRNEMNVLLTTVRTTKT